MKPDDVVKAVEAVERILEYGFSPEDRQLLTETPFYYKCHSLGDRLLDRERKTSILRYYQRMFQEKSGVEDTGTFGFHLKRTEALLDKLEDGRYRLTSLGQTAYTLLRFTDMTDKDQDDIIRQKEAIPESEEEHEGLTTLSDLKTLLLDKERLDRYNRVAIHDCAKVIIDRDVNAEMFRRKVSSETLAELSRQDTYIKLSSAGLSQM